MRVAVLGLAALVVTGCTAGRATTGTAGPPALYSTELTIEISAGKSDRPTKAWTLTCPEGGTLPQSHQACDGLAAIENPFAPVPKNTACTEIYGGPEVAEIHGRFRGRKVLTRFSRTNGCEIARWNRVRFLFPGVR